MAPEPNNMHENGATQSNGFDRKSTLAEGPDYREIKASRHPRWTRHETLVLILGKKVAENRVLEGRNSAFGSNQIEPKWDSVSSYCRRHGVNRRPVQCRKRWSNLLGDFKKIKGWESQIKEEAQSYWVMTNDLRKEKKLPGFYDKGVYDVLDGREFTALAFPLALVKEEEVARKCNGMEEDGEKFEVVFDSGRNAATEDGLFPDFEQETSEKETIARESLTKPAIINPSSVSDEREKQTGSNVFRTLKEGWKRRRLSLDGCDDTDIGDQLIKVLEKTATCLVPSLKLRT